MYYLSDRANAIQPSLTLAISAQAKKMRAEGLPVVNLSAGEPDFDTPEPIKQAAGAAMAEGFTKYTPAGGIPELKQAVVDKYEREQGLSYSPDQVVVSNGGKHALHNIFQAVLNPGDEVIIPGPYWLSYPDMVKISGGVPVFLPTDVASGYKISPDGLQRALSAKTKILIINSPSNPTGAIYSAAELAAIAAVVADAGVLVVSDDVYEKYVYDGVRFVNLLSVAPKLIDQVVIVNSASKTYSMPGWRMGYALGPEPIIRAAARIQGQATSCPSSIAQKALTFALRQGDERIDEFRQSFEARRNLFLDGLNSIDGVKVFKPSGAFYLFVDLVDWMSARDGGVAGSLATCEYLLQQRHIACIPGAPFGDDRCVRFSFVTDEASIHEAIARLRRP